MNFMAVSFSLVDEADTSVSLTGLSGEADVLDVGHEARYQRQVERPVADHLAGNPWRGHSASALMRRAEVDHGFR